MSDDDAESVELCPYKRFNHFILMRLGVTLLVMTVLVVVSGEFLWLFPILFVGGGMALNFYLLNVQRAVPQKVRLDEQGIAFTTKAGAELSYAWGEVETARDRIMLLRYLNHLEIRFKNSSEILRLYRASLRISEENGQTFDCELVDSMVGSITLWDRPIRVSRSIIERHVPGFQAAPALSL